jgi:hypothetical protein
MLVQGAQAQNTTSDVVSISESECNQILGDIAVWDDAVEKATLNLIFKREPITIHSVTNELTLMGYDVHIHLNALKHMIVTDIRKVVSSVSIL